MANPSRLWGYVLLKDPNTGEFHVPFPKDAPDRMIGYPINVFVNFVHSSGSNARVRLNGDVCKAFKLDAAGKPTPSLTNPVGTIYSIPILENPSQTDPPRVFSGAIPNKDSWVSTAIVCSPAWQFSSVQFEDWAIREADRAIGGPTSVTTTVATTTYSMIALSPTPAPAQFPAVYP